MSQEQLEQVEVSIAEAKKALDIANDLKALTGHPLFKKVILEGYFEKEASRLVLLRADPQMQDEVSLRAINDQITAVGQLRQHFSVIMQFGRMAEKAIGDYEETRQEILAEEAVT